MVPYLNAWRQGFGTWNLFGLRRSSAHSLPLLRTLSDADDGVGDSLKFDQGAARDLSIGSEAGRAGRFRNC
jgi:hypothetical protein